MMHNTQALYTTLQETAVEIERQIKTIKEQLRKQIDALPYPETVSVYQLQAKDGTYPLVPLLAAKAQVVSSMALLKATS